MHAQKFFKYIIFAGIFIIPFSVLIVADSLFFPFITGKAFFYRTVVEVIVVAWIVLACMRPEYRPTKQKIQYVLIALLGVLVISNSLSLYPYKAFWSNFERMDGFVALIHHVALFFVLSSVMTTQKLWQRFWQTSLAVSSIVFLYALLQRLDVLQAIQGGARVDGTFGNAAYLAVYALFHIVLAVWLMYRARTGGMKTVYGLLAVVNFMALYWTATRGALLGLAVGTIVTGVLVLITEKEHKQLRRITGAILILLVIAGGVLFISRDASWVTQNQTLSRVSDIRLESGNARFMVWQMAFKGITEKPVIGWGQEGFSPIFATYYTPDMYGQEPWFDRAHNIVIDWLVAGGIVGFLLYGSVLVLAIMYIWKGEWFTLFEKSLFTGLYAGYMFQNLFVFDNIGSYFLFFSTLSFFAVGARKSDEDVWCTHWQLSRSWQTPLYVLSGIVLVVMVYIVNVRPMQAGQTFLRSLAQGQSAEIVFNSFEKALAKNTFVNGEITEQLLIQAPGFYARTDTNDSLKEQYRLLVEGAIERQYERQSHNARFLYVVGVYYNRINQHEKSIEFLEQARTASPQKQIILFELAFAYIAKGEEEKGMELLQYAWDIAPEFEEARKMYVLGAIYTGNRALERELITDIPFETIASDNRFIQAYASQRRFTELLILWEQRVLNEPSNVQNYVSLAATYLEVGQRDNAILWIEKAIEVEPRFEAEGQRYITDIREGRL